MKKIVCALLTLLLTAALAGCGDAVAATQNSSGNSVASVMQQQMNPEEKETPQNAPPDSGSGKKTASVFSDVDVDLTRLSSTMVYSEVFNMMVSPEDYVGKSVRMDGAFALYRLMGPDGKPVPDRVYYACVIADATACCQQGLEFVLAGDPRYPDDYPELGTDITVAGEFQIYMEDGNQYCHLVDAKFE